MIWAISDYVYHKVSAMIASVFRYIPMMMEVKKSSDCQKFIGG